jgi:hypothetical protein
MIGSKVMTSKVFLVAADFDVDLQVEIYTVLRLYLD